MPIHASELIALAHALQAVERQEAQPSHRFGATTGVWKKLFIGLFVTLVELAHSLTKRQKRPAPESTSQTKA